MDARSVLRTGGTLVNGTLTMAIVALFKVDADPERVGEFVPSLEDKPPACLENAADEEEFDPVLQSGEREQHGREGREGRFFGERAGDVREVR